MSKYDKEKVQASLIKAQRSYIKLLEDEISKNAVFLFVHGVTAEPDAVKLGEDLREEISDLEDILNLL